MITVYFWCDGHFTNISACGCGYFTNISACGCGGQELRLKSLGRSFIYIYLHYVNVKFLSCI